MASWVLPQHVSKHTVALQKLQNLQIIQQHAPDHRILNPLFRAQLRVAITGGYGGCVGCVVNGWGIASVAFFQAVSIRKQL